MIWFDLVTPKSVMFFRSMIAEIKQRQIEVLVTAREGKGYHEVVELLELHNIPFFNRGTFGGADLGDKLRASIDRQLSLMEFVQEHDVHKLVCLCSVDANRVAFGLGIPIVNFYDIPLSDHRTNFRKALPQARLTLPLSNKAFRPFMVPEEIFQRFSLEPDQIYSYPFLDVVAWLHDFEPDREYFLQVLRNYGLDSDKPTIVIREEEFKASYVMKKYPILYEALEKLRTLIDTNIIIVPRYEAEPLEAMFPYAAVLKEKMVVQHLLAFADLFIGGGGTLNSEACYFGTPTISTRSFICHYDKFQIDKGLMHKADTPQDVIDLAVKLIGKRNGNHKQIFGDMQCDIPWLVDRILE
ncbi:DUF354 domain-containing protein [Desulfurispira natronophila]|uniref:DUF354 domain-containing protein n=1 Tax=Desulfurispira natronophila TaxID=682562 RepID=A0A7W7Y4P3_9BACT|nr:hypothetical protein [Desulfurispira natronophila]